MTDGLNVPVYRLLRSQHRLFPGGLAQSADQGLGLDEERVVTSHGYLSS
jgi:hypothetical protein